MLSQDIAIAVNLLTSSGSRWTFAGLGETLKLSTSQCHTSFQRLIAANLVNAELKTPIKHNLLEFLAYGGRYVFPPVFGQDTKGLPTAYSARPMNQIIKGPGYVVWPMVGAGTIKGKALNPVHKSVPLVARVDAKFYQIFATFDSIRIGGARERSAAQEKLRELILDA